MPLTLSVSSEADATEIAQPLPLNETSADAVAVELHEHRQLVATQRIEAVGAAIRVRDLAEIPRMPVVVDDDVAVQVLEVHQPSISRAVCRAATSRSISARVL